MWWRPMTLTAEELSALALSLRVALWCVAVALVPGVLLAWLLARREFPGKSVLEGVIQLPLVLPPVVTGYLLLLLLGRKGALGQWFYEWFGITLAFTWKGAVIASAVEAFPLLVRSVRLSISLVEPRLEQAAQSLGASPVNLFFTITLPLALPGVITGVILAFARSLGEFGSTITFVGNIEGETRTLPLAIYTYTQVPHGTAPALRLVMISVVVAYAALIASEWLARRVDRRMGTKVD